MSRRVIIMNFKVESQAYQAFSELKRLYAERQIKGEQMAVVTHVNTGVHQFKINDFLDFTGNDRTAKSSFIGMVIGILGGPLGILLGWFAGSMIGATQDAKELRNAQSVFEHMSNKITEGHTGLVLIADEDDNRPLNQLVMNELGGEITRLVYEDVEQELDKAKTVEKKVKDAANNAWTENAKDNNSDDQ
ncbi:DUF1269 domain-containing protein [Enterococcus sp. BWB1-3]|uniref:DUF1269 domain-containing protein n=1 Tax=unclassified Enterococcus TaxID=2608891 RepID=UPI0019224FC0|nr:MULTISPECIES: DUF1269 domain-containing protein [unclassified Enterococcus]MBL1230939.1 DUF1269 domain-containing protein [Enterococcus sp. BWB1-3]MCB5950717.1 DUF1269 domain-containing protein [Enterococcus sp. BWT-B8]MCB5955952.1 DUF1269 domain-containing protein [Enterococcus sp. CWB-B31]